MADPASSNRITPEQITTLMHAAEYRPMTSSEIASLLKLRGRAHKDLGRYLHDLVRRGEVAVVRKNRYCLAKPADLVTGRLGVKRSGEGYLTEVEVSFDVHIPRDQMHTGLPGDLVVARLDPAQRAETDLHRSASVIRILERARRVIVGTLKSTGKFYYVVAMDPSYQQDFYVADPKGANLNDRVVIQFIQWENRHVSPEAEVIEVIGPEDNPSLDTRAVIRHYGLSEEFPPEVIRAAEEVAWRLEEPGERLDLRQRFIFTVDPSTARDFDDALSLEVDARGQRVLGVHIADVSHFVETGNLLDQEAARRGNSVYLPDKVLPMLPEQLSNGLCSLRPGEDRLTFSVFITFDDAARPVGYRFAPSRIRSMLRLTYEQAYAAIRCRRGIRCQVAGIEAETVALIQRINELAQALRQARFAQWALDLEIPEFDIVVGTDGMIADIRKVENDLSHQMIEECMVAANEAVDRELSRRGLPLLHRLHEPPFEEKMEAVIAILKGMGYRPGDLRDRRHLSDFLRSVKDTPLGHDAQVAILRSMKRAVYSVGQSGHYGLAKKFYAHFTSPIRRYPDLVVHRILRAALQNRPHPYKREALDAAAMHCSQTEQIAEQAERDIIEIKKYRFLLEQLERGMAVVHDAVVVKTTNFGMFVEIHPLEIQGLVHVSNISDHFVRFDPHTQTLRAGKEVYKTGSRIRVRVLKVDFEQRRIDFQLQQEDRPATGAGSPLESQRRRRRRRGNG